MVKVHRMPQWSLMNRLHSSLSMPTRTMSSAVALHPLTACRKNRRSNRRRAGKGSSLLLLVSKSQVKEQSFGLPRDSHTSLIPQGRPPSSLTYKHTNITQFHICYVPPNTVVLRHQQCSFGHWNMYCTPTFESPSWPLMLSILLHCHVSLALSPHGP